MDEDCDCTPVVVKLESELDLSGVEESSAGPRQEVNHEVESPFTSELNTTVPENINLTSVNECSSEKKIKYEDEFLQNSVVWIKVENTEDEVPATDPLLDDRWQDPPPTVPSGSLETNFCFPEERIKIKEENVEDPLLDSQWHVPSQIVSSVCSDESAGISSEGLDIKEENGTQGKIPQNDVYELDARDFCEGPRIITDSAQQIYSTSCVDVVSSESSDFSMSAEGDNVNCSNDSTYYAEGGEGSSQNLEPTHWHSEKCSPLQEAELSTLPESRTVGNTEPITFINFPTKVFMENHPTQDVGMHFGEQSFASEINNIQHDKHPMKRFCCTYCQVCFKSKKKLKQHLTVHSDERPLSCEICFSTFKLQKDLTRHTRTVHSDIRPFSCDLCSQRFKLNDNLNYHLRTVHSDQRPFSCDKCSAQFKLRQTLNRHLRTVHIDERPFSCDKCSACFKIKSDLNHHLRKVHTDKRPFSCDKCSASYKSSGVLKDHILTAHSDERSFCCGHCQASFQTNNKLKRHLHTVHSDKRPFSCDKCFESYRSKNDLKHHVLSVHSDERPFSCDNCQARFHSNKKLKRHLLTVHSDQRPFACDQCSGSYKSKSHLNRHVLAVHFIEKPFSCSKCEANFKLETQLMKHLVIVHSDKTPFPYDEEIDAKMAIFPPS